ncbi:MAG: flagellar biosynthesis protein FlhB [Epsilonproteobacteria bacterium]|nr:flagellar biosynthesis protein FlhB [Campylobacterota bacterium]
MADDMEKTEEPTPKKIEDARKKGNVPKSQDVAGIVTLFVAIVVSLMLLKFISSIIFDSTRYFFTLIGTPLDIYKAVELAFVTIKVVFLTVLPIAFAVAIAGIIGNVAQFGFLFTTESLTPDLSKIDPIKGTKNLFSLKKIVDGVKNTFKAFVVLGVGFIFFFQFIKELPHVELLGIADQLAWLGEKMLIIALVMLFVLAVFALADLVITRKRYFDGLKMSKQEIKDEMKNMEGDPLIKAKIRQIQMEASRKRMMSEVPNADVVITNPTHYAVALKYDQEKHAAPVVIAKGADQIALQIKKIARENNVHIVENPPVARALYAEVDIDQPIPEKLFATVAEILAYVYKMERKK